MAQITYLAGHSKMQYGFNGESLSSSVEIIITYREDLRWSTLSDQVNNEYQSVSVEFWRHTKAMLYLFPVKFSWSVNPWSLAFPRDLGELRAFFVEIFDLPMLPTTASPLSSQTHFTNQKLAHLDPRKSRGTLKTRLASASDRSCAIISSPPRVKALAVGVGRIHLRNQNSQIEHNHQVLWRH